MPKSRARATVKRGDKLPQQEALAQLNQIQQNKNLAVKPPFMPSSSLKHIPTLKTIPEEDDQNTLPNSFK